MKFYTFPNLKKEANTQGYRMAALEDQNGTRRVSFNPLKKKVVDQLDAIENRLKSDALPDGVYYVCFATGINGTKTPDRFPIAKGNTKEAVKALSPTLEDNPRPVIIKHEAEQVLTWDAALTLHKELAELRAENERLRGENALLQARNVELESEIDEQELSEEEKDAPNPMKALADAFPSILHAWGEEQSIKKEKLALEKAKFEASLQKKSLPRVPAGANIRGQQPQQKQIAVGTQEYMDLLHHLYENNPDAFDDELDKIEVSHPEFYAQVIAHYGLTDEEGGDEQ